jgi:DNA polymerase
MSNEKIKDIIEWYHVMDIDDMTKENLKEDREIKLSEPLSDQSVSRIMANNATNLNDLKNYIMNFENCSLKQMAKNTVFSDGVVNASIMLIGEAPGQSEDEEGIPFCGASGKLLDQILKSIDISRSKNAYITNCVFWRPPANRRPTDEEIEICKPFVEKHIALINPQLLILVGSTAVSALLGKEYQISKIRKEYFQYGNQYLDKKIPTTALFHPAYLLRQPMQKQDTWYDLLKIRDFIKNNAI